MTDEDVKKVETLKAELQKVIDYFHECEEELERWKQEVPLGVPLPEKDGAPFVGVYELGFPSEKSFFTFSKRFQNYVTATRDNAKDEPIDIKVLLPLLKKGYVAMDESGFWYWHKNKPSKREEDWRTKDGIAGDLVAFNLKPAEDWRNSLMECGL